MRSASRAPSSGQSSSISTLHLSPPSLNRTIPVSNNTQTIHSSILLYLPQSLSQSLLSLENCLSHLRAWFCHNGLALNPDKTDAVLFGTRNKLGSLSTLTHVDVAGTSVQLSKKVEILGATLDQQLTFHYHVNTVCSASFYHLRSFRHVRPALTQDIAKALGSAVIGTKLDYAKSILHGTSSANIKRLQRVQNALARVVLSSPSPSATKNLQRLHWLPVQ